MSRNRFHIAATAVALSVVASVVSADPIVITGGAFTARGSLGSQLTLRGEGLSLQAPVDPFTNVGPRLCAPCEPPADLPLSAFASIDGRGPAMVEGISYPAVLLSGGVTFSAPAFNVSALSPTHLGVTAPFAASGTIIGQHSFTGPELFRFDLVGSGMLTANFTVVPLTETRQGFLFKDVTYAFQPTPEPGTSALLMVALAIAGVAGSMKRRALSGAS